jgi:bifunctional enzyme CysN/CysC
VADGLPAPCAPAVIWLTGLPGAGKSTIARGVVARLRAAGRTAFLLDGDELRAGLCADLGFSPAGRLENVRRAGEVARLLLSQGATVICALVSPYRAGRDRVRAALPPDRFIEVYVKADAATCRARDPKGLYARAHAGTLAGLTGAGAPYEEPSAPELVVDTTRLSEQAAVDLVLGCLAARG